MITTLLYVNSPDVSSSWFDQVILLPRPFWLAFQAVTIKELKSVAFFVKNSTELECLQLLFLKQGLKLSLTWVLARKVQQPVRVTCL
jgi:hypothetical protein